MCERCNEDEAEVYVAKRQKGYRREFQRVKDAKDAKVKTKTYHLLNAEVKYFHMSFETKY